MRASIAYFAGVATVVVAIAAGLGGGLLLGDVIATPQGSKQAAATRLDQRAPIPEIAGAGRPLPFMAATEVAAPLVGADGSKEAEPQTTSKAQPQSQQVTVQAAEPKQSAERNQPEQSAAPAQPVSTSEPAAANERAAPEDAFAKARDDVGRRDTRRAERERRKAERREQRRQQRAEMRKRQREGDDFYGADPGRRDAPPFFRQPAFGTGRMTLFDDD